MLNAQQLYFVTRIKTAFPGFEEITFNNGYTAQLLVNSLYSGKIIFLPVHNALAGLRTFHQVGGPRLAARLTEIEYVILANPGGEKAITWQGFIHQFKKPVMLLPDGRLESEHQLFKRDKMDFLLESKQFGEMMGIQFLA